MKFMMVLFVFLHKKWAVLMSLENSTFLLMLQFLSLICSLCDFFTLVDIGELTVVTDGTSYCGKTIFVVMYQWVFQINFSDH